jgi:hypothetical protein
MKINFEMLERYLNYPLDGFFCDEFGEVHDHTQEAKGYKMRWVDQERYVFKDNGAKILAVAHLDTVQPMSDKFFWNTRDNVYNPHVDNRLGAYTILYHLKQMGMEYDILLTENEEACCSTAQYFKPPEDKEYNWMFSFDREGEDVVMYQYQNDDMLVLLADLDITVGNGSYSDIGDLDILGVKGFNFGCGMHKSHHRNAYFNKMEYYRQIKRFKLLYDQYKDEKLTHTPTVTTYRRHRYDYGTSYKTYHYGSYETTRSTGDTYTGTWSDCAECEKSTCVGCSIYEDNTPNGNLKETLCDLCRVTDYDFMMKDIGKYSYCFDCAEYAQECHWQGMVKCVTCRDFFYKDEIYQFSDTDFYYCPTCVELYKMSKKNLRRLNPEDILKEYKDQLQLPALTNSDEDVLSREQDYQNAVLECPGCLVKYTGFDVEWIIHEKSCTICGAEIAEEHIIN